MNSNNEISKNEIGRFIIKYIWIILGIIFIMLGAFWEAFGDTEAHRISNITLITGVISVFLFYLQQNITVLKDIKRLEEKIINHENHLNDVTDNLIHHISILAEKIDLKNIKIEEFQKWKSTVRKKYIEHLITITPQTRNKFNSMLSGEFILSSDIFKGYYMELLKSENVKYYYSSAIVNDDKYFIKNNIEDLKNEYTIIADHDTKVELLFILNDGKIYDPSLKKALRESYKELEESVKDNPNVTLLLGFTSNFNGHKEELWKKDFGIAGDIACAEMSAESDKERYTLYFTPEKYKELSEVYRFQKHIINKEQKNNLAKLEN